MPIFIKLAMCSLASFFVTSIITVTFRTIILDLGCDPKFSCLCSFSCLFTPIVICTSIFACTLAIAYWLIAKDSFQQTSKYQCYVLSIAGAALGLFVFGYPLATIGIIYSGYIIIWLPLSFVFSLGAIQLSKKYNKGSHAD